MYTEITTVEGANKLRKEPLDLNKAKEALSFLPPAISRGMVALATLQVVVHAVNNDDPNVPEWKPDFNDTEQEKWYPWYQGGAADGSGSGFSFHDSTYVWTDTFAYGGARLALKDDERAEHMNKYFSDLYKDLWLILE